LLVGEQIKYPETATDEATKSPDENRSPAPGRQPLQRLRCSLRDGVYLVAAVAFHVLPESLLRSVGAKFLSVFSCLHRNPAVRALADPPRRAANRYARDRALPCAMRAECDPSNHSGDGTLLYRPRRLHDFHSGFGHIHRAFGAGIFS